MLLCSSLHLFGYFQFSCKKFQTLQLVGPHSHKLTATKLAECPLTEKNNVAGLKAVAVRSVCADHTVTSVHTTL